MKLTLNKHERLKSKKLIDSLFQDGRTLNSFPLKLVYKQIPRNVEMKTPAYFGVTVGKRNFKKAVDRNLIKRRVREAYRINKQSLYEELDDLNVCYAMMFIYISREIEDYKTIESAVLTIQKKFSRIISDA